MKKEIGINANYTLKVMQDGKVKREVSGHNLVPLGIRTMIAQLISGTSIDASLKANIVAIGDSTVSVSPNDTQLENELVRTGFDNRYNVQNVAYLDCFIPKAVVGVMSVGEVAVFVDGDASVTNSGHLLSKININEDLNGNEDLSINITFTITG